MNRTAAGHLFPSWLDWVNPLAWRRDIRRCLTGASVSLLLAAIVSMNIIWGYPWIGMFAAMTSMFVVGWTINRLMRPVVAVIVESPDWVAALTPLRVSVKLINRRALPALEVRAGVMPQGNVRVRLVDPPRVNSTRQDASAGGTWVADDEVEALMAASFPIVPPRAEVTWEATVRYERRGLHALPPVQVESLFPFHLFCHSQRIAAQATIAVAPPRIDSDTDPFAGRIRSRMRGLTQRWTAGDSTQYVGSREYQPGMSVRRWDFASWARLGKPILREFSAPSTLDVMLVVDTSPGPEVANGRGTRRLLATMQPWGRDGNVDAALERLLSLSAMVAEDLVRQGVAVHLLVTDATGNATSVVRCGPHGDVASMMIALASAERVGVEKADKVLALLDEAPPSMPVIVLARRGLVDPSWDNGDGRNWIDTRDPPTHPTQSPAPFSPVRKAGASNSAPLSPLWGERQGVRGPSAQKSVTR